MTVAQGSASAAPGYYPFSHSRSDLQPDKGQLVGGYLDEAGNTDGMLVQFSGHHS